MDQSKAVDTQPRGFLPDGHIDKAGNLLRRPICWYGQVGCGPIELAATPEGVVGRATLADVEKARPGVHALLDYMVKLTTDIMETFPVGKLPPVNEISERPTEQIEAAVKGPLNGGCSIYALHYPPA
jgi:creatinine amidohydrolase